MNCEDLAKAKDQVKSYLCKFISVYLIFNFAFLQNNYAWSFKDLFFDSEITKKRNQILSRLDDADLSTEEVQDLSNAIFALKMAETSSGMAKIVTALSAMLSLHLLTRSVWTSLKSDYGNTVYKITHKGYNIDNISETLSKIENRLRNKLVGQDEAINKIMDILIGYFEAIIEAKNAGKKYEGGLILYLTGLPGTGKSEIMKIIREEMDLDSCVCRMSDVVEDRGNNATSVVARLTKAFVVKTGKSVELIDTNIMKQIKSRHPTLYCFDEVDKMRKLDSVLQRRALESNGEIIGGTLDEMIRNFSDTGQINGIDCSGSILIATSNETPEQLSKLENSLYNRYKECNVCLKCLDKDDYIEIIKRASQSILDHYKKEYNVDIELDGSILEYYSDKYARENSGGRAPANLMKLVRCSLKRYKDEYKGNFKDLHLLICANERTGNLFIR